MTTWAFSDIHGCYNLWESIAEYCGKDDKIYFLGDAIDRGPQSLLTFISILKDPRVTFLRGNHEQILLLAARYDDKDKYFLNVLEENGGKDTWLRFLQLESEEKKLILDSIECLPIEEIYINKMGKEIHLCHAGFTPESSEDKAKDDIRNVFLIQSREHFSDAWPQNHENEIIVHGHTPLPYFIKNYQINNINKDNNCFYCDNHKINIDNGCVSTRKAILLNLDTLETVIFQEE